jgi:hypothetical protein
MSKFPINYEALVDSSESELQDIRTALGTPMTEGTLDNKRNHLGLVFGLN